MWARLYSTSSSKKTVPWLTSLPSWQLKHLAFLTGVASTGTKAALAESLQSAMVPAASSQLGGKVLSVDMGVKNLAFCVLEPSPQHSTSPSHYNLLEWKRVDLTTQLQSHSLDPTAAPSYTPATLSNVAYKLAASFLAYQPSTILIERQRFRSGGGAAIQEWTVRVNMLESMLWACLETLRQDPTQLQSPNTPPPSVVEMSPARVGAFWNGRKGDDEGGIGAAPAAVDVEAVLAAAKERRRVPGDMEKVLKRGFEKKEKIALVRGWLAGGTVVYDQSLSGVGGLFTDGQARRRAVKGPGAGTVEVREDRAGKLDDLADCVVQAVTFALWEENRRRLLAYSTNID